jgi:long-chain acyl-CoA synthetase
MVGKLFNRVPHGAIEKAKEVYSFMDLLNKYSAQLPRIDINPREHLAYIVYTGGTTGFPKGVQCTHAGMVSCILDMYDAVEGEISEGEDILALVAPLFHTFGKGSFIALALSLGNATILMPLLVIDALLEAIQKYKATLLLGVPTLYRMILECDRLGSYDLSSLKFCWSGGDLLPDEVFRRFNEFVKFPIRQAYGSTETGHLCMGARNNEGTATSLGKPFPSRKMRIVDPDTLKEISDGQAGELIVSSPYVLPYLNKPEETAKSFVELDGEQWYRMGDFVKTDANGELHFIERTADIIKHKGYRISASEIEAALQNHPAVIGACVIGIPDPMVGERIKATVVLKEDARGVGADDLIAFSKQKLAPYKVPQYIDFRDMLPKSKVGKMLRREIREEERRKILGEGLRTQKMEIVGEV